MDTPCGEVLREHTEDVLHPTSKRITSAKLYFQPERDGGLRVSEQKPLKTTREDFVLTCPIAGPSSLERQPESRKTFRHTKTEYLSVNSNACDQAALMCASLHILYSDTICMNCTRI